MYSNENGIDIVEIEGLLIDTRISNVDKCKSCRNVCDVNVLSCHHVFCSDCLSAQPRNGSGDSKAEGFIVCPQCQQITKVQKNDFAASLLDYTTEKNTNSCTTVAKSVCTNCCTGKRSTSKCCSNYEKEELSFFCITCEIPICDKCMAADHKGHYVCNRFEKLPPQQQDFKEIFEEKQGTYSEDFYAAMKKAFSEVERHHEIAKERILNKYENCKYNLEKWKEDSIQQLEHLRTEQEVQLTELSKNLKKVNCLSEDTCGLIANLMRCGNGLDVVSLKNLVKTQLLKTISNHEPALDFNVEADCESVEFEDTAKVASLVSREDFSEDSQQPIAPAGKDISKREEGKVKETTNSKDGYLSKGPVSPGRGSLDSNSITNSTTADRVPKLRMDICLTFGKNGEKVGQFESPRGFCVGWDGDIFVADSGNHRIQVFDRNGRFQFQFGDGHGMEDGQLNNPIRVAVFRNQENLIVADWGQFCSRLQIFTKTGKFIRKIVTRSAIVTLCGLTVTPTDDIVIVDKDKAEIIVISDRGEFLKKINYRNRLVLPCDIDFYGNEFYLCDLKGHAIVVFGEDGEFKRRFESKIRSEWVPGGILVTDDGTVLVGYSHQRRFNVAGFNRVGQALFFSRSPELKVSSCCGLEMTPGGEIVSLSKVDNRVIVAGIDFKRR